jgi:8-oxo-dGTP pyrophosphatase MutT (NUDIX family)
VTAQIQFDDLRRNLANGESVSQERLDEIVAQLSPMRHKLRPGDKSEQLPLFDRCGKALGTSAPRWVCHFLGLRHRCAHILLTWSSPSLGEVIILQIRDWTKDDSPGHIDISVGGHMTASRSNAEDAAFAEMVEELGLERSDLEAVFRHVGGYSYDESRGGEGFFNSEWRDVYVVRLKPEAIENIRFADGEVAGLVLLPLKHATRLLEQSKIPVASALRESLPKCLALIGATN